MLGCDVSVYQGEINWQAAKSYCQFAFAKASQGVGYTDAQFVANHDGCKANGIPFGAYHFFTFSDDPVKQADHFLSVTDGYEGQLLPMVDVEAGTLGSVGANVNCLAAFLRVVEQTLNGKRCIIYTDPGYWQSTMGDTNDFNGHPLWIATWDSDAPELCGGWASWSIWQFEDDARVAGISGSVDRDRLNGEDLSIISR